MEPSRVRESVAALDAEGRRITIHPAEVRGRYTAIRKRLHGGLILFYLALPWLRFKGLPLVLFDVPQRRFALFGATFWAFDAPKLFFLVALLVFGLFFATALWGRVWCGYACPQTVFTESMFRRVESWIEGRSQERRRLDAFRRGSAEWIFKKGAKWLLFTLLAYAISLSFAAFFIGSEGVTRLLLHPASLTPKLAFGLTLAAGIFLLDFGYLREQFCIVACPYGRFQSVLMDRHSPILAYGAARGEPRGKREGAGDCVDCARCVQVCPTGIDIRKGLQMECIACAACADACDEVMDRLERPRGLVAYTTEAGQAGQSRRPWRGRTLAYAGVLAALLGAMIFTLLTRRDLDVVPLRGLEAPYQEVKEGGSDLVINHMRFMLTNLVPKERELRLKVPAELEARGFKLVAATNPLRLASTKQMRTDVFLTFPKTALNRGKVAGAVEFVEGDRVVERQNLTLVGPFQ